MEANNEDQSKQESEYNPLEYIHEDDRLCLAIEIELPKEIDHVIGGKSSTKKMFGVSAQSPRINEMSQSRISFDGANRLLITDYLDKFDLTNIEKMKVDYAIIAIDCDHSKENNMQAMPSLLVSADSIEMALREVGYLGISTKN